jgi:phage replication O-like protein O
MTTRRTREGGFLRLPNTIIDAMPTMEASELRVVLAIARQTIGWQKVWDVIAYSQLEDLTGMARSAVWKGLTLAVAHGYVESWPIGGTRRLAYRIVHDPAVSHIDDLQENWSDIDARFSRRTGSSRKPTTTLRDEFSEQTAFSSSREPTSVLSENTQKKDSQNSKTARASHDEVNARARLLS